MQCILCAHPCIVLRAPHLPSPQAVPALADRLMALQAQHEQLERTQAELVAQHEVRAALR